MKYNELLNLKEPLTVLLNQSLPIRTSFKINKIIEKINDYYKEFDKKRYDLSMDIAKKANPKFDPETSKDEVVKIEHGTELYNEYMEKYELLKNQEIDIELEKIPFSSLGNDIKITPTQAKSLELILDIEN